MGGWLGTVTAGVVFRELFDGHLVALLLFLLQFEEFGGFATVSCCSDLHCVTGGSSKPLKTLHWSQSRPTCQRKAMKLSRSQSA